MTDGQRIALVTRASEGSGPAIAKRLVADGFAVLTTDQREEAQIAELYEQIERAQGRLDVLVNNAGIADAGLPLEAMSVGDWEAVIGANLTGTFLMSRGAVPLMRRNGWGRIVNVLSLTARGPGQPNRSALTASQTGIVGFSRGLANETGRLGITVNCLVASSASRAATASTTAPADRAAEGSDIAHAVAWFCSPQSSLVTGMVLDVNGGAFMP